MIIMIRTTKELEKYAAEKLPVGVALNVNKEHWIKPYAEEGEKYSIYYVNTFKAISHPETIEDAVRDIDYITENWLKIQLEETTRY